VGRQLTMGAITASIAHEIKQPLTAIVANAEAALRWLSNDPPNRDKAAATLQRIVRDGQRAGQVIETVRAMFKKDSEEKALLDVNNVVRQVFTLLRSELQKNEVVVEYALSPQLPRVQGDSVQLQQVILNLAMNAIDAMSPVTDRPRSLRVSSARHDPAGLALVLEDSGMGIDPAQIERIFEPFFTTKSHGMGMGLSICRSIVEAHRGQLTASLLRPHGTAFQIILPADG
jgi:C4-dicarboxylate-specific signal transduction histidine kinase